MQFIAYKLILKKDSTNKKEGKRGNVFFDKVNVDLPLKIILLSQHQKPILLIFTCKEFSHFKRPFLSYDFL